MDEPRETDDERHQAKRYEIRLKGRLDNNWAEWFGGMALSHGSDGTTVLTGPVADQAALHGLLQKLRDLGVTLISVNDREPSSPERLAAGRGGHAARAVHSELAGPIQAKGDRNG